MLSDIDIPIVNELVILASGLVYENVKLEFNLTDTFFDETMTKPLAYKRFLNPKPIFDPNIKYNYLEIFGANLGIAFIKWVTAQTFMDENHKDLIWGVKIQKGNLYSTPITCLVPNSTQNSILVQSSSMSGQISWRSLNLADKSLKQLTTKYS